MHEIGTGALKRALSRRVLDATFNPIFADFSPYLVHLTQRGCRWFHHHTKELYNGTFFVRSDKQLISLFLIIIIINFIMVVM